MSEIVVVEDERNLRELFCDLLSAKGHQVTAFDALGPAAAHLARHLPDLLLLDVKLPDGDGLGLLETLRDAPARPPVIVMTAFGTVERAVQALRAGARDFLVKPFENARLLASVAQALEAGEQLTLVELGGAKVTAETGVAEALVGGSGGLREVVALLPRIAATDATVLLRGESGTGKELVARAVHQASPRLDGPFTAVNCAALPPGLLESELFGFERGAFTGAHARRVGLVESASGGTLFLDEIGDMSLEAQARLLRVLQERCVVRIGGRVPVPVDVRVVAASHRDLAAWAEQGRFRADLLYRLAVVPIDLPPLRGRPQDIPGLVDHFLRKHGARHGLPAPTPTAELLAWARVQPWPGNVRELENWVERAVVLGGFGAQAGGPGAVPIEVEAAKEVDRGAPLRTLRAAVAEAERAAVVAALRAAHGNKAEAARLLGVSYKTLFNKLHEHQIREALSIE